MYTDFLIYEILAVQQAISRKCGISVRDSSTVASQRGAYYCTGTMCPPLQTRACLELGVSCFPEFLAYTQDVNQHAEQIKAPLTLLHRTL